MKDIAIRMNRTIISICLALVSLGLFAQEKSSKIWVSNNFKSPEQAGIVVKWITPEVLNKQGVNLYRSEAGKNNWVKVNTAPIEIQVQMIQELNEDSKKFIELLQSKSIEDVANDNILKALLAVQTINDPVFAELMATAYTDYSVNFGDKVQYKLMVIEKGKEVQKAISENIKVKAYTPEILSIDWEHQRHPLFVAFKWNLDPDKYYGYNIYREKEGEAPIMLNKGLISSIVESDTVFQYIDYTLNNDSSYLYSIEAYNYMGQLTERSEPLEIKPRDMVPPLPPMGLDFDPDTLNVSLFWNYMYDSVPDLAGFRIFRTENPQAGYEEVTESLLPTDLNSYVDVVPHFGEFYYKVVAEDSTGNQRPSSTIFVEVKDVLPPVTPISFKAKADTGIIHFTWKANTESDLRGYYICKALEGSDKFIVINKEPIAGTEYKEKMPKRIRNTFLYSIVAADTSLNRSKQSPKVAVQMPDIVAPERPVIIKAQPEPGSITLHWIANVEPDLAGYTLYRKTKDSEFRVVAENIAITHNSYSDNTIQENMKYMYQLVAIDSSENVSAPSKGYAAMALQRNTGITIENFKTKYKKDKIELLWDIALSNDYLGSMVYRGIGSPDKLMPISGKIKAPSELHNYKDKNLKEGKSYFYQIRTFSASGEIVKSTILSVEIPIEKK
jgi:fibronectin type 3 domain-containing protein